MLSRFAFGTLLTLTALSYAQGPHAGKVAGHQPPSTPATTAQAPERGTQESPSVSYTHLYHDADIVVYPKLPGGFDSFIRGCRDGGTEVVAIDTNSTTPFPGRPNGQDRVQLKFASGQLIDMFFPRGYCTTA